MTKEFITHEAGNEEAWVCVCGNQPNSEGFFTCDPAGNEIEPAQDSNWTELYVCARCGRIIQQGTREIVGRNPKPKMLA